MNAEPVSLYLKRALASVGLSLTLLGVGCEEKKKCYTSCYEESLKGYADGNCGHVEKQTREECAAFICNPDDPPGRARTAWGEEPDWCKETKESGD